MAGLPMKIALAIFAKTPDLTPAKTRLARSIGQGAATEIYQHCIAAISDCVDTVVTQADEIVLPYWALAEAEGPTHPMWSKKRTLWTGEGDLGHRLHHIYSTLHAQADAVILMGTDSPQLTPDLILNIVHMFRDQPCVLGPCRDGGFYAFGASVSIPKSVWTSVAYSQSDTLEALIHQLHHHGISTTSIIEKGDLDVIEDVEYLLDDLDRITQLSPAQQQLKIALLALSKGPTKGGKK